MSTDLSKKIDLLFHPTHLPMTFPSSQGKLIQVLDNKVSFIALKVIRNLSFILLCATAISFGVGCVAFWPATLTIGVLAMSVLGIHLLLLKSKCYHIPQSLEDHKKEAASLVLTYKYLDEHAKIKECIKKDLIHPIKALFSKHPNINKFFKYEILDPKTFKEALLLELKYFDFDEALTLIKDLKTHTNKPEFISEINELKPLLKNLFFKLIQEKKEQFEEILSSKKENFRFFYNFKKDLKVFIKQLQSASTYGIVETNNEEILTVLENLKKHLEKLEKKCKETQSAHEKWDKELQKRKEELSADYQSLFQHYRLSLAKKEFIDQLNQVQQSSEAKKEEKRKTYQIFLEGLKEFDDPFKTDLENFYSVKLEQESRLIDEETKFHIQNLATRITSEEISELTRELEEMKLQKEENNKIVERKINEKHEADLPNITRYCDFSSEIETLYDLAGALLKETLLSIKKSPEE